MNASLPSGIELSLKEAGFSATELLILRHLMEADTLTVREIANKTGKSTGVLDQSMKKLMVKNIVDRTVINGHPRYQIRSLDTILRWMRHDMQEKQASLERRHQSLQQFVGSLKVTRGRPDMEYFHGPEGMEQAYLRLLMTGGELLTITPILTTPEDDPLRTFRVDYFRRRQYRKIFQRVIAPDTSLARRFQSRDPFEYRKTVLIPPEEFPLSFEKTVVGDTVACMNQQEQSGCFIRYPELANAERSTFEAAWNRATHRSTEAPPPAAPSIPATTRILSSLREFFLSKRSITGFLIFGLLAVAMTVGLYLTARSLNLQRIRSTVMAIASTGALQFDAANIDAVRTPDDIRKPAYAKIIATLNLIRRSNPEIKYAYLMRKTADPRTLTFIADADSLYPKQKRDINGDNTINTADALSMPGDQYDISSMPTMTEGFLRPSADRAPTSDQWGTFISGAAPVKNATGGTVAILGVDTLASKLDQPTPHSFMPLFVFAGCFILFMLIRFVAVNRSLMQEICLAMKHNRRTFLLWFIVILACVALILYGFQRYTNNLLVQQTGKRLTAIATMATTEFSITDLDQLHFAGDMRTEAYQRVFRKLNEIRNKNPEIKFAYIFRPVDSAGMFEFVADADANFDLPFLMKYDINDTGPPTQANENVYPGLRYFDNNGAFSSAMKNPGYDINSDKWGKIVSGASPIFDTQGRAAALLGFDVDLDKIAE